jgi:hypothetical protein
MITIGDEPTALPKIEVDPELGEGTFYAIRGNGVEAESLLEAGQEVVLFTESGKTELRTLGGPPAGKKVRTEGTYVAQADRDSLGEKAAGPKVRLYNKKTDGWKKAKSASAVVLLVTTALGLASLLFGLWLAIGGETGTSAAAVAERSEALLAWVVEPLDGQSDPGEARRRSEEAGKCLTVLRGGEAQIVEVGGVGCKTSSPPFWKDKDSGGIVGAFLGLVVALLGVIGVTRKFGFRQTPDS